MGDAFLIWEQAYAVGHRGLDGEHRRLVDLINEISGAAAVQLSNLSTALYFASVEHFRHENSVMRDIIGGAYLLADGRMRDLAAINEAAVNDHCAEHARALIELERLLQTSTAAGEWHGRRLASELRTWFIDHAINHDAHLKAVFQGREELIRPSPTAL